jgi:hypothetical protein
LLTSENLGFPKETTVLLKKAIMLLEENNKLPTENSSIPFVIDSVQRLNLGRRRFLEGRRCP